MERKNLILIYDLDISFLVLQTVEILVHIRQGMRNETK